MQGSLKKLENVLYERRDQFIMRLSNSMQQMIKSFQRDFNKTYPYLKIEVDYTNGSNKEFETISEEDGRKFYIHINSERLVSDVEKNFKEVFGLPAHIFRKSSKVWVATSYTAHWTLEKQNLEGEQISNLFPGTV